MTTTYTQGTITVSNGSTTVTGVGTNWVAGGILPGDDFRAAGLTVEIASVNSATSITLARAWPGSGQSSADYSIRLIDAGERSLTALNELVGALGSGNLTSLASLTGAANKLPYFTGAGLMALTDITPAARALLGRATIEQSSPADATAGRLLKVGAAGAALGADVYHRSNILGIASQLGGVPTGAAIERGANANGSYVRLADGTQICWHRIDMGSITSQGAGTLTDPYRTATAIWTFPAGFSSVFLPEIIPTPEFAGAPGILARVVSVAKGSRNANSVFNLQLFRWADTSDPTGFFLSLMAIGRWF